MWPGARHQPPHLLCPFPSLKPAGQGLPCKSLTRGVEPGAALLGVWVAEGHQGQPRRIGGENQALGQAAQHPHQDDPAVTPVPVTALLCGPPGQHRTDHEDWLSACHRDCHRCWEDRGPRAGSPGRVESSPGCPPGSASCQHGLSSLAMQCPFDDPGHHEAPTMGQATGGSPGEVLMA